MTIVSHQRLNGASVAISLSLIIQKILTALIQLVLEARADLWI